MSVKTDPYTFSNGTVADALQVNARFLQLYTLQNGQIDYTNMDLTQPLKLNSTVKLIFDADQDGDTYITAGTDPDNLDFVTNGTNRATLNATALNLTVPVYIPTNSRLYFDGGTTYSIYRPTGQTYVDLIVATNNLFRFEVTSTISQFIARNATVDGKSQIGVTNDAGTFIWQIDGSDSDNLKLIRSIGGDKEILEVSDDGTTVFFNFKDLDANGSVAVGLINDAAYWLWKIDGGDNDYLKLIQNPGSGDVEQIEIGITGSNRFVHIKNPAANGLTSFNMSNDAGVYTWQVDGADNDNFKLIRTFGGDKEILEVSDDGTTVFFNFKDPDANGSVALGLINDATYWLWKIDGGDNDYLKLFSGGSEVWEVNSAGELLLPAADPPTSGYLNRNSGVGAFLNYTDDSGVVTNSYNIVAVTDDDGDGQYDVEIDTNLSNAVACANVSSGVGDRFCTVSSSGGATLSVYIRDVSSASQQDDSFSLIVTV